MGREEGKLLLRLPVQTNDGAILGVIVLDQPSGSPNETTGWLDETLF